MAGLKKINMLLKRVKLDCNLNFECKKGRVLSLLPSEPTCLPRDACELGPDITMHNKRFALAVRGASTALLPAVSWLVLRT